MSLDPGRWARDLKRWWLLYHLADTRYRFMWDPPPPEEFVALDCETTGLDVQRDEIIAIAAVRIVGDRILTSERLDLLVKPEKRKVSPASVRVHRLRERDLAGGLEPAEAATRLMHFIGSRPLVGYYLEFDLKMLHRILWPMLGMGLPQPCHEVSGMYYDYQLRRVLPQDRDRTIDLRFATLMKNLGLPTREAHDALNDAVMAAMAFVKLRHLMRPR